MGVSNRRLPDAEPLMTDRAFSHPIRFAAVIAMLLTVAGVRDTSAALATTVHVIEVSASRSSLDTVSAIAPVDGDVIAGPIPAGATAPTNASGGGADPDSPEVAVAPESVDRSIVHVQTTESAGSGFLVEGGLVVTNAHVVGAASTATVWFSNGARRESRIVALNEALDLAVLDVPRVPRSAEPLELVEDITLSAAGSSVWAWGYPFEADVVAAGFSRAPTVSAGIVSARRLRDDVGYLQTDAAVNPGSSGGPLLNAAGRVIGINTLVLTPGGEDAEGLNFALDVAAHLDDLLALLTVDELD